MAFQDLYSAIKGKLSLSSFQRAVAGAAGLEPWAKSLSESELIEEFTALKNTPTNARIAKGFALVRESASRNTGLRHFDVQLLGAATLLQRNLAEMRTGEGKTLTVTAAASLLALDGQGVHVVTANPYLARRDAQLMAPVYSGLGLTVASISDDMPLEQKKEAYACDIVYGVGSEFGFDYLKDNLTRNKDARVQRGLYAAIVDEIDSVLIDEARVPLVISGPASDKSGVVLLMDSCVRPLKPLEHFQVNLKEHSADLTELGYLAVEEALLAGGHISSVKELYETQLFWVRQLHASVKAYALYKRDRDYVIVDGEVVLVDRGTGRKMHGRRLEDGLHEALEAKEGLSILAGTATKASITFQNFYGMYQKLSGLSGTAFTDAQEFSDIYSLEVVQIPTNKPLKRIVREDIVYSTMAEKLAAVVQVAKTVHQSGQPLLVGCGSIRDAEVLDRLLTAEGLPHETLTAKHIEREAPVIANAGRLGAITVATNMAGRGTDILLGGEKPTKESFSSETEHLEAVTAWEAARADVVARGGLFVLGTERNGLRRVDNQLAGRCGRQGDPGTVQFLLSLEDELLNVFGKSGHLRSAQLMATSGGGALSGKVVGRLVTAAQKGVESVGFSARKDLLKFDSSAAQQRQAYFELRAFLLDSNALSHVKDSLAEGVEQWLSVSAGGDTEPHEWSLAPLKEQISNELHVNAPLLKWVTIEEFSREEIVRELVSLCQERLTKLDLPEPRVKSALFDVVDSLWEDHLGLLDELRKNVSFKGNTGLNPVYQFHLEAFALFESFIKEVRYRQTVAVLGLSESGAESSVALAPQLSDAQKVGLALEKRWIPRNELCPCGSGKRFKHCHGKI